MNGCITTFLKLLSIHTRHIIMTRACIKGSMNGMQTALKRKRQTGSATEEEHKRIEANISNAEEQLATHRQLAANSREYYTNMTIQCKEQWLKIQQLS